MTLIRTVFQPDQVRDVDEHEAAQLAREGLLLPLDPEPPAAAPGKPQPVKEGTDDGGK